ncbi:hypothetical protein EVAR_80383_1 [Eumeta japonica]|uniref:Uncharacterized protein n=1 Tax=Eumeta variegata TaxID=151549 RepID=A0A4C1VI92_EUMVA|nr:hypothetical protein EVAR_80383_1 [Eumeta japonica]
MDRRRGVGEKELWSGGRNGQGKWEWEMSLISHGVLPNPKNFKFDVFNRHSGAVLCQHKGADVAGAFGGARAR